MSNQIIRSASNHKGLLYNQYVDITVHTLPKLDDTIDDICAQILARSLGKT